MCKTLLQKSQRNFFKSVVHDNFILELGISIGNALLLWRQRKIRTSFKTLVSKKTTIWRLKKYQSNNKLLEKITSPKLSHGTKNIHRSKLHLKHTQWRKKILQLMLLNVCESFRFRQIKKLEVYFGLYESSFTFIEKRRPIKYCLCEANLISYMQVFNLMGQDVNLARKIAV